MRPSANELLMMPMSEVIKVTLGHHERLTNALKKADFIDTPLGCICLFGKNDLLRLPNLGRKTLQDLETVLHDDYDIAIFPETPEHIFDQHIHNSDLDASERVKNILVDDENFFRTARYKQQPENQNEKKKIIISIDIQDEFQRQAFIENFDRGREMGDGKLINGSFNQIAFNALGMMVYNAEMLSNAHAQSSVVKVSKTHTGVQIILDPTQP